MQDIITAKALVFVLSSIITCSAIPPPNSPSITPVHCENQHTKESGVCMFYWSCTHVVHGVHIASCMDRFLIGSCCKLPENTASHSRWFLEKLTKKPLSEIDLQHKEDQVTISSISEITSSFYKLQSTDDIQNENEGMTPDNLSITNSKGDYFGFKSNRTLPGSETLMLYFPPVIEQRDSIRNPDYSHKPVALEPSHDSRTPVHIEPFHDMRKPATIEKSHDLRNPLSQVYYHEMHTQNNLNKSVGKNVSDAITNYQTESSILIKNASFTENTNFSSNTQMNKNLEISKVNLLKHSTVNFENVYERSTAVPGDDEVKVSGNSNIHSSFPEFTEINFELYLSSTQPSVSHHFSSLPYSSDYVGDRSTTSYMKEAVCGIIPKFPTARIIGGHKARYLKWPWMISLQHLEKNRYKYKCGAVLLNSVWAATVAHCVDKKLPNEVILSVGDYNLHDTEELYPHEEMRVFLIVMHPDFNPHTFENDVALLRFYQPVPNQVNVAPICLPGSGVDLNDKVTVVIGWGKLAEDGQFPGYLQEARIPIIPNEECQTMYIEAGYLENISESFLCAGRVEGGVDSW